MSEFWIEQTDNEGPWGDGSWVVWHRPDGVEAGTVDDHEIVALCETEKVAEATLTGLKRFPMKESARSCSRRACKRSRFSPGRSRSIFSHFFVP